MQTYESIARDRGVTTIPSRLREEAGITVNTKLSWVELEPDLWLVGPSGRPEETAPVVQTALAARNTPFPKLMRRLMDGRFNKYPARERHHTPVQELPTLTEEQMIALGDGPEPVRYGRGR